MADNYTARIGFMFKPDIKKKAERFAAKRGVNPSVIYRKALVKYLKEKGVLDKKKQYL